jgi:tryptophan synthase alpha chain
VKDARAAAGTTAAQTRHEGPRLGALGRLFERLRSEGRVALIPYVTCGFPDADQTVPLLEGLADAGADVIELGIPFSDPLADGPAIQKSSFVALERGMTMRLALDLLREFRAERDTPVVVFTYLNPVMRYGVDAFCRAAHDAGAQGLLLTDLPLGSDPELERTFESSELELVRLVAPTTPPDRIAKVSGAGRGFLYYISRTGVTGARAELPPELTAEVKEVKARSQLPVAVGFGISTPEQAAAVAGIADGVVVGSALITKLEKEGVEAGVRFIAELRQAMDARARSGGS